MYQIFSDRCSQAEAAGTMYHQYEVPDSQHAVQICDKGRDRGRRDRAHVQLRQVTGTTHDNTMALGRVDTNTKLPGPISNTPEVIIKCQYCIIQAIKLGPRINLHNNDANDAFALYT